MNNNVKVALEAKAKLGECPRWDERSQLLYWVDINAFQLHRFNPATGNNDFLQFDEEIGCFCFREGGGFLLAMRNGFFTIDDWNTDRTFICDPESDMLKSRFNDGRADANGRMFAGSVYPPKDYGGASIYSLENGKSVKWVDNLLTANGIAFSPDNKTFYYADTPSHAIQQCDYDLETGTPSNCRVFFQFPHGNGRPDGACVDSEGCYWTALYEGGRVVRLSPKGEILQEIEVPARCPTMVALGGPDLKTLFITSVRGGRPEEEIEQFPYSGAVFKVEVGVAGLPEHRFAG